MELKPCPFCGETLIEIEDASGLFHSHQQPTACIASEILVQDEIEAEAWNRRAGSEQPTGAVGNRDYDHG
jgi:hypothetical protein